MIFSNRFIKNIFIYLGGGSISGLISYLLMPVLSRYLAPADYGIVYMFMAVNMFFVSLIGIQSDTYFTKNYFELQKPVFAEHVGAILKVTLLSTVVLFGLVCMFKARLSAALSLSGDLILLAIIVASACFISVFILRYYQLEGKAKQYIYVTTAMSVINIVVSLLLVTWLKMGWKGRIIGISVPMIIQAFMSVFILYKNHMIKFEANFKHVKTIIYFGAPLVLGSVGGWVINLADKLFITKMVSISATGIYGVGASLGMVMGVLVDSCARAWVPYFFKNIRNDSLETNTSIVKLTYLYSIAVIIMSFVVTLMSYVFIRYFLGVEYRASFNYVVWISLGQGFAGIRSIFIYYLIYKNKTFMLSGIIIATSLVNIALNYFLIRSFGAMGAAYAVFLSSVMATLLTIGAGVYSHKMPWLYFIKSSGPSPA
ncbi:MAG: oligosaccharide flippase family protein [Elusimicrobiota bacterium]